MNDMSAIFFRVALHLAQMKRSISFKCLIMIALKLIWRSTELDFAEFLIDVPVDLVAGKKDKVIRPSMVRKQVLLMLTMSLSMLIWTLPSLTVKNFWLM